MSDSPGPEERLHLLLKIRGARRPTRAPAARRGLESAFVSKQIDHIDEPALQAAAEFLSSGESNPGDPLDQLALRLLLDDYADGVARLRAVAQVTGLMLSRVKITVAKGRRLQRTFPVASERNSKPPA